MASQPTWRFWAPYVDNTRTIEIIELDDTNVPATTRTLRRPAFPLSPSLSEAMAPLWSLAVTKAQKT